MKLLLCCRQAASNASLKLLKLSLLKSHGLKLPKAFASSSLRLSGKFPAPLCKLLSLPSILPEAAAEAEALAAEASGSSGSQASCKESFCFLPLDKLLHVLKRVTQAAVKHLACLLPEACQSWTLLLLFLHGSWAAQAPL